VAVVLTPVQTKQIRINIHKRNNTKTQYKQYKTQQIQVRTLPEHNTIVKTPTRTHTHTLQNPHTYTHTHTHTHTHSHTLQNKLKQPQYKIRTK